MGGCFSKMGDQRGSNNRWNWEVAGFEPRKSVEQRDDYRKAPVVPMAGRRYSMSISSHSELSKHTVNSKFMRLKDKVKVPHLFNVLSSIQDTGFELIFFFFFPFALVSYTFFSRCLLVVSGLQGFMLIFAAFLV